MYTMYVKTALSTSQKTQSVSIINISRLNVFKEVSDIFIIAFVHCAEEL